MRYILAVVSIVLAFSAGNVCAAQNVKIGVVDLQRVVSECKAGVKARSMLKKRSEELNRELKTMLSDLEKEKAQFDKDVPRLSEDARSDKERRLQKKGRDIQHQQREAQEELKEMEAGSLKKLVSQLNVLMMRIGADGGFAAILDKKNGVFFSSGDIDLTSLLIKRVDAEFGK